LAFVFLQKPVDEVPFGVIFLSLQLRQVLPPVNIIKVVPVFGKPIPAWRQRLNLLFLSRRAAINAIRRSSFRRVLGDLIQSRQPIPLAWRKEIIQVFSVPSQRKDIEKAVLKSDLRAISPPPEKKIRKASLGDPSRLLAKYFLRGGFVLNYNRSERQHGFTVSFRFLPAAL
jgi:hypothetical protein